jgi:hypothetical protein
MENLPEIPWSSGRRTPTDDRFFFAWPSKKYKRFSELIFGQFWGKLNSCVLDLLIFLFMAARPRLGFSVEWQS